MGARHFSDLAAWQLSASLRDRIHELTDRGAAKTNRAFYNDIRDAASGIPNSVAEGHGRFTPADNRRFLNIARASLAEVQNRLLEGKRRKYWSDVDFSEVWALSCRAEAAIAGLMRYLGTDRAKRNANAIRESSWPRT
ncbi:MAG TPA: four helix bundle protein [Vicinamibacterales bacterium]|nr:four helix bundle protein [Vicinamibacterales bacterium]